MSFDTLDLDDGLPDASPPPEEGSNRTFLFIAAGLGAVALLALICIGAIAVLGWQSNTAELSGNATLAAQDTSVAEIVNSTATAAMATDIVANYTATPTKTPIPPTATPTLTPTPVVAVPTTVSAPAQAAQTGTPSDDAATATARYVTLEAIVTMNAGTSTAAIGVPTETRIPNTGFADDIGLPLFMGLAALLIVVIFLARRLRTA